MAITTFRISTASTNNQTSYASGSFTPAVSDLLVVIVYCTNQKTYGTLTSSAGTAFTLVGSVPENLSANMGMVWVANSTSAATAQTVTYNSNTALAANGCDIAVYSVSGMTRTGLAAIRQVAQISNHAAGTPAPAFSNAVLSSNPIIGAIFNSTNPATMTPPSGWTEGSDNGYATPTTGMETAYISSGFTSSTVTWGSASASVFASLVVELDTSTAPTGAYIVQSAPRNDGSATSTSVAITLPNTPTPGNLLLYFGSFDFNKTYAGNPSGWTPVATNPYTNARAAMSAMYRIVQSGDTATWTIPQITTADTESGILYEITGQAASNFINAYAMSGSSTTVTTISTASVTPTVTGTLALAFFADDTGAGGTQTSDVASISSGWTIDGRAYSDYHPSWTAHQLALTTDTTTPISAVLSPTSSSANSAIILLIAPASTGTGTASISLVQQKGSIDSTGSVGSVSVSYNSAPTAGNMLYAVIGSGNGASNTNLTGFSDTNGNTWTKIVDQNSNNAAGQQIWVAYSCKGGATTVSVSDGGYATWMTIGEVSGIASSAAADRQVVVTGSGSNPNGLTSLTLNSANEFVLSMVTTGTQNGTAYGVGTGYGNFLSENGTWVTGGVESQIVSSTAGVAPQFTGGTSGAAWSMALITFKSATTSGGTTTTAITKAIRYTIQHSSVALTKPLQYADRKTAVAQTKNVTYRIRTAVAVTKGLQYAIRLNQALHKALTYGTKVSHRLALSLSYRTRLPTSLTKATKYSIDYKIAATKILTYAVRHSVAAKLKPLAYAIRTTPVALTKAARYIIRRSPAFSYPMAYRIRRPLSITKALRYATDKGTAISRSMKYTVTKPVAISKGLRYITTGGNLIVRQLTYALKISHALTRPLSYDIRKPHQLSKGLQYDIRRAIAITKPLQYAVKKSGLNISKGLLYGVRHSNQTAKSLLYAIRRPLMLSKALQYRTRRPVAITKGMRYAVRKTGQITKQITYVTTRKIAITKVARYAVKRTAALSTPLTYRLSRASHLTESLIYAVFVVGTHTRRIVLDQQPEMVLLASERYIVPLGQNDSHLLLEVDVTERILQLDESSNSIMLQ